MNLNKEQIQKVIHWMNTWEQLKDTAIPLRFKEEFTKQLTLTDVVKSLKTKDLMTFEDYKNNLFIKADGVYQPKKSKKFRWYSERQLKKMYNNEPL